LEGHQILRWGSYQSEKRTQSRSLYYIDDHARAGLRPEELKFRSDIAEVLLGKAGCGQEWSARSRGEGSVSGLGFFLEGLSSHATDFNRNDCISLQLLITLMEKSPVPHASATDGLEVVNTYKASYQDGDPRGPLTHVLMDISLLVMNGLVATREVRKFESEQKKEKGAAEGKGEQDRKVKQQKAVICSLTGLGDENVWPDAERSGMDGFMTKPIQMSVSKGLLGIGSSAEDTMRRWSGCAFSVEAEEI
jgi:CheY-like chemotaxis protein